MQIYMFLSFFFPGVDFIKCVSYGLFIIKFNDNHILTIWTAFISQVPRSYSHVKVSDD